MTYDDVNILAFSSCDTNELKCLNSDNTLETSPNKNNENSNNFLDDNLNNFNNTLNNYRSSNTCNDDVERNLPNSNNCQYYSIEEFQNLGNLNNFNIFHNNMNGLETKIDDLHHFLSENNLKFDIIAITETSQKSNHDDFLANINLQGYTNFSSATNSNKGGTAIYARNTYDLHERIDLNETHDLYESVWIEIQNKSSKNVICGSIYRHPDETILNYNKFLDYLEKCLITLSNENKEIYICGDFNSDLIKIDKVNNYNKFYELLSSYGFLPQILQPSRIEGSSATIIDNIFTNVNNSLLSGNILTDFSDHFSQFVSVKKEKIEFKNILMYKRDYSKFSDKSFRDDVEIQNFDNDYEDVNDQFNDFYLRLKGCVDRHAPLKKLTPKEIKLEHKPWITKEIIKMIQVRNKLFQRKKRQPNNEGIKRLHNMFRNRVNREIKKSKKEHYAHYFEENKNNIKKTWDGIRSIINIKKSKRDLITKIKINDKIILNQNEIAESLNNFFVNVGPETEKSIPVNPIVKPDKFLKNRNQVNFLIAHISNEEILEIINQLENKSTGPQSIPFKLLKLIPDLILVPLCKIINNSFQSGIYPNALKISKVIPIHKGGSTEELNNYRPISLLSIFDKIIEKLMHIRLYNFFQEHNILFENQFGFRKNNSTTYALIEITEKIKESIDNKKFGCGIFIDLRKAFDTVNHDILLKKLEHYGIRDTSLSWFKSYLTNRKQYVYINGESSQLRDISCGVPQGSVLGPLLFLIYINDLPNISEVLNFYLFADDTNIYYEAGSMKQLESVINKELKKLYTWLIVNRLSLNIEKNNFIVFHPYNKPVKEQITLKIHKKAIAEKDDIKYLGVMIDSTLTWKSHIDKVSKSISRAIGLLYKIRPFVNQKILKMLYYSLVYPHLIYAVEVWGSADITYLERILVLQKRIVRMLTFSDKRDDDFSFPSSSPLFYKLDILKIHDIFKLKIAKFIYSSLKKITPINFHTWFKLTSQLHNYSTRSKFINITDSISTYNLFIPTARTTHYGLKKIKVKGPKVWNDLPPIIRIKKTYASFINALKIHLIGQYKN